MKWSIFTFHVKLDDEYIIYNTLNGNEISLEESKYDLKNLKDKEIINYLIEKEFIYNNDFDEKNKFMESLLNEWNNCGFLGLHILTTTGCNFNCPYCYQSGIKANLLSEDKIDSLVGFLDAYIKNNKIKECNIELTGGEPTTNFNVIYLLLPRLKNIFDKYNVDYKLFIVTNGYLLTKEKVDFLSEYNWKRLQITIDGMREVNNKRRVIRNNKGSFDTIIENLDYIVKYDKIEHVNLRVNYDKSNIKEIPEFLEFIKERYGTDKIILSLGLITKTVNCAEVNKFIDINGIVETEFFDNYIELYKVALNLGFKMNDIFSFDGFCTSKLKHGFIIEPNGNIVKCVSGVGREDFIIGNVYDNKISDENYLYKDLYEECLSKECPFLPLCHTGCRFESFIKNADKHNNICKRELLEKINKEIITINYKGE